MAAEPNLQIPILTDAIGRIEADEMQSSESRAAAAAVIERALAADRENLIAELQTQIAASTFALTDRIMRAAFAEMEASVFEQIAGKLRSELPEMIDALLRERFGEDTDY
jgi:hypothetical protein